MEYTSQEIREIKQVAGMAGMLLGTAFWALLIYILESIKG
jgi:hypothetical protein